MSFDFTFRQCPQQQPRAVGCETTDAISNSFTPACPNHKPNGTSIPQRRIAMFAENYPPSASTPEVAAAKNHLPHPGGAA